MTLALASCGNGRSHRHQVTSHNVHEYVQHVHNSDGTEAMLYWYLIASNNGHYYSYSSPIPVTSFSNVSWTSGTTNPISSIDQSTITAEPDAVVTNAEFSADMQSSFTESNGFESSTSESSSSESSSSSSESSSSSSDGGSSDGGGGGDGGGGD